jgi:protease-4
LQLLKLAHPSKPLYAVIGDVGASGAYYIAAVADYIYADKASTVGSIGVIGSGFGFDQLMAKLGVERRTYTAGGNKGFLDPFSPEKENQKVMFQGLLDSIHEQFIAQVELGRGERLVHLENLYSGAVWHGQRALELGLIDGLGSLHSVARDQIGEVNVLWYSPERSPIEEVMEQLGAQTKTAITWGLNQSLVLH